MLEEATCTEHLLVQLSLPNGLQLSVFLFLPNRAGQTVHCGSHRRKQGDGSSPRRATHRHSVTGAHRRTRSRTHTRTVADTKGARPALADTDRPPRQRRTPQQSFRIVRSAQLVAAAVGARVDNDVSCDATRHRVAVSYSPTIRRPPDERPTAAEGPTGGREGAGGEEFVQASFVTVSESNVVFRQSGDVRSSHWQQPVSAARFTNEDCYVSCSMHLA
ncbi:hypothetical protein BIW11_08034 [Tropilaelaps mercedesae]|uniref:Uncharacterized protein n=1 Tax=Tropilaelaps mercedesae TaxID=418985 RepID=A0A1V9XRB7_9ACAR|nr:hypothetical protein BIW11_08034 [Tropilaelaps mercedesae]